MSERRDRRPVAAAHLLLAVLAYVPVLRASPGRVGADTKTYLYLDPGELLRRALTMWDPNVGMGTVTHQTIGYLWPMGPYYWVLERLGAPDWFAQRLWLGSILFAAGAGVLFLCRTLGWRGAGPLVAALAYQLSPYSLDYAARISVILLPWAALPWLIALAVRATRRGGWRHPALFALVVALVGGVNATALILAGLAPVLWFPFAVWGTREVPFKQALAVIGRIGVLTLGTSLWWLSGLWAQSGYGIDILRYTETIETVARTSSAAEILRGLGYWFFYGNDKIGPWIEPGRQYTQQPWLIAVGFAIPVLGLLASAFVRWAHRAYFATLVVVGTLIAIGPHPYEDPAPLGAAFKSFATSSTVGLALRSTPRAVPLVSLGLAVLLGAGITALASRVPRAGTAVAVAVAALVAAGLPPLFTGDLPVGRELDRPEEIPRYWREAAAALDARGDDTRVLEIPGSDFASYRWGNTVDPITPYLMDRPYVARELIPYGSPATADLLNALDRRMQEGVFEPQSLAPLARLMGAGDVVLRADLQHERFRTPRPQSLWLALTDPRPVGLGEPVGFGPRTPNRSIAAFPLVDEIELSTPRGSPHPPAVGVFPVQDPTPIVRARPIAGPTLLAGDGEGLVDAAAAGLVRDDAAVLYAASLDRRRLEETVDEGAHLVLTDTNRLRARRWGTVRENMGYTEQPGDRMLEVDPADARLPVFPDQGIEDQTIARLRGVERVVASHYGNPVSYTPEDRPANALDGDPRTAWRVGAFADVEGERIRIDLGRPVTTDVVTLLQPVTGPRNRFMTSAVLRLDDRVEVPVTLDDRSRVGPGQPLGLGGMRTFRRIEVEVGATNAGKLARYDGQSGVGIAELAIRGVKVDEVLRLPTELLTSPATAGNRLSVVLTRLRTNPKEPVRTDEEVRMTRSFELPTPRRFTVAGSARISAYAPDEVVDGLLGLPQIARSSGRLPGDLSARAIAAIDGDPATAWMPGLGPQEGGWIEIDLGEPRRLDRLALRVRDDGRHSVPTRVRLDAGGQTRVVDVPAGGRELRFPALVGDRLRVTIEAVRPVRVRDYYSEADTDLPVAIAEVGVPGLRVDVSDARVLPTCRTDLVNVDGVPVEVRLRGSAADAIARRPLTVEPCDGSLDLPAGAHEVRTAQGRDVGVDVDRVVLDSAGRVGSGRAPAVRVLDERRTSFRLAVEGATEPFWLVLGQSHNAGWQARAAGRDLGAPQLVDGYANGWLVDPAASSFEVDLVWTPQRVVWSCLALSVLAALICLALALAPARRRGRARSERPPVLDLGGSARRRWWVAPIVGIGAAVAGGPVVGAVTVVVSVIATAVPKVRIAALGAAVALAAAGGYTTIQQLRYDYPPDFAWPANFPHAHPAALCAIALLAADALLRPRGARRDVANPHVGTAPPE